MVTNALTSGVVVNLKVPRLFFAGDMVMYSVFKSNTHSSVRYQMKRKVKRFGQGLQAVVRIQS